MITRSILYFISHMILYVLRARTKHTIYSNTLSNDHCGLD